MNNLTKNELRTILIELGVELTSSKFNKTKKAELIALIEEIQSKQAQAEVESAEESTQEEQPVFDLLGAVNSQEKVAENNADIVIDKQHKDMLVKALRYARKNMYEAYISSFIIRSLAAKKLFGKSLVDGKTKQRNTFSDEQNAAIDSLTKEFADAFLIPYKDKGYVFKAEYMAWFYGTCEYYFLKGYKNSSGDVINKEIVYIVDYNNKTITRKGNGNVTVLDESAYAKLNSACKFKRIIQQPRKLMNIMREFILKIY